MSARALWSGARERGRGRARRLAIGLATLLGGTRGFFIPHRYAAMALPCAYPALETDLRARARDYLAYATEEQSDSVLNAIAHMERDRIDPSYAAPVGAADVGSWSGGFARAGRTATR